MINVKWLGRGGQGAFTVSRLLGIAVSLFDEKYALAFPTFGPERRGAPVSAFTKIDDTKIHDRSEVQACDYLVVLDETLIDESLAQGLKDDSIIIINTQNPQKYRDFFENSEIYYLDATKIALEILKIPITNTAMLGALISVADFTSLESGFKSIENEMKKSIINKNKNVLEEASKQVKKLS